MLRKIMTVPTVIDLHRIVRLVTLTVKYAEDVTIEKSGKVVDAKSVLGVMSLTLTKGDEVIITTSGDKERELLNVVVEIISH